ncbi:MAG: TonB-dependent receptor [Pyrinomonadaceae bacterium]
MLRNLLFTRQIYFFLLFFAAGITTVSAQIEMASLTGQVTDPQGAVVSGARVVVTSQATNISVETTTTSEGYYTLTNLRPNLYTVEITQQGFRTDSRKNVELNVGQKARIDFELTVGDTSAIVDVTTENQSLLQREDSVVGSVVDNRRITQLPLLQRSWDDLLSQVAGVQNEPYTEQGGGTASGRTGSANIHGARSLQNNFILDGQDNNTISENVQEFSTQVSRPSVDAIGEFKVATSPFSAEYGRSAGGAIIVTTKSGTNQFHGVGYEYVRNRVFDANDFFSNRVGRKRPQRVQNQFGGNLGGPIWKNKAFFFADYEGTRIRQGILLTGQVPLQNELAGDFSSRLGGNLFEVIAPNASGQCVGTGQFVRTGQIFNPATTRPNPCFTSGTATNPYQRLAVIRDPYPGNIISNINPTAARLATFYPAPNLPGRSNNFVRTPSVSDDNNRFTTKLDYKLNAKNDVFGRYSYGKRDRFLPGVFGGIADGSDSSSRGLTTVKNHSLLIGWNYLASSSLINQFRFGYNYAKAVTQQEPFGQGSSSDFVPGIPDDPLIQGGLPAILLTTGGFSPRLGSADFNPKFQKSKQFQFNDSVTLIRGAHTFRFGTDVLAPLRLNFLDIPVTRGRFAFSGIYTALSPGLSATGNSVADFLTGIPVQAALTNVFQVSQRRHMYSFFGQDDWKVTPKLTVNLGLRYDFGSPYYEANNKQTNFDQVAAAQATTQAQALASLVTAKDGNLGARTLVKPDRNNFAPRVGFAYSATDKLVVRGGYGIFYNLLDRIGSEDQISLNPPQVVQFQAQTPNGVFPVLGTSPTTGITLTNGFPANTLDPNNIQVRNLQLRAVNPDSRTPNLQQGSIGVQYQFRQGWFAEANFVRTRGSKLYVLRDLNQPNPSVLVNGIATAQPRPFSQFGIVEYRDDLGISNYKALETTVVKRFSDGYTVRAVYTFAQSKDNTGEHLTANGSSSSLPNSRDASLWYGYSDFDVRHRVVINGIWELPFGKDKAFLKEGIGAAILGGWELAGTFNHRTGRPFTVSQGGDPLSIGTFQLTLPDQIGDPNLTDPTINRWFNVQAFQALPVGAGRFGNQLRNQVRGPKFASLDLALHRSFGLWNESSNLEFRWEVFNALNRANFALPNRDISGSNVGTITALQGDPRVMQFAVRLNF